MCCRGPAAEGGCCGCAGADEATFAATLLPSGGRLPLCHRLPVGLRMSSAPACRNICPPNTNVISGRSREIAVMGQIKSKGPGAALPGQPEGVKHSWEVPPGQSRAEQGAQAHFENLR